VIKPNVEYIDWGRISYKEAWDLQSAIQKEIIQQKRSGGRPTSKLLICEHNPVFTLGKSGKKDHLLFDPETNPNFEFFKINRGGDITYHGPGQLTVYPIFDLEQFKTDVHWYVRSLEEVVIRLLDKYSIIGKRLDGYTGVWLQEDNTIIQRKICAIGVHLSRWVSMHGLALNVCTNLEHFNMIVPCGIQEDTKVVTSMQKELQQEVDLEKVKTELVGSFQQVFEF
jgi:lipoyl(octanoyl) transferase